MTLRCSKVNGKPGRVDDRGLRTERLRPDQ